MKKILAIFALTAACTTFSSQENANPSDDSADKPMANPGMRNEIDGLEDIAYDYVESTWGKPDSTSGETSGARVVVFKNIHTTTEDPDSEKPIRKLCDIELKVDAEGTVTDWDYKTCQLQK